MKKFTLTNISCDPGQHLPWAKNRPYDDGDLYNCLGIQTQMKDTGKPYFDVETKHVLDEVCKKSGSLQIQFKDYRDVCSLFVLFAN